MSVKVHRVDLLVTVKILWTVTVVSATMDSQEHIVKQVSLSMLDHNFLLFFNYLCCVFWSVWCQKENLSKLSCAGYCWLIVLLNLTFFSTASQPCFYFSVFTELIEYGSQPCLNYYTCHDTIDSCFCDCFSVLPETVVLSYLSFQKLMNVIANLVKTMVLVMIPLTLTSVDAHLGCMKDFTASLVCTNNEVLWHFKMAYSSP